MKKLVALSAVVFLSGATTFAADQTWTGHISDSACGVKHEEVIEGQGKMEDGECTLACVRGGSKYVFVVSEKVYEITNQDNPDVVKQAGRTVMLTGEMKGNLITVSKIAPAGK